MDLVVLAFAEVHALVDAVVVLVPVHLMAAAEAAEAHLGALIVVVAVVAVAVLVRHHAIIDVLIHANIHANMIVLAVVKVAVDHVKKHA